MISFTLKLKALTLLTVGWNIGDVMGADIMFARKLKGGKLTIYIPGSSVKGSLRSAASKVAESYGFSSCGKVSPWEIKHQNPCDVCRLFGYPHMNNNSHLIRSPLIVSDFMASKAKTVTLTRVSIDDKTLTAEERKLYTVEHVFPGTEFVGTIKVDENAKDLLPLLMLAIAELRTGRFGRRSIVDAKIEGDVDVNPKWKPLLEELKNYLWEGRL